MTERELRAFAHGLRDARTREHFERMEQQRKDHPQTIITSEITPRKPRPILVDDEHLAVRLITLKPGTRFKLPDDVDDGLPGKRGVLLYANPSRARVRYEKGSRTFTAKQMDKDGNEKDVAVTVEQSGETDIAANTMVIPLEGPVDATENE